MSLNLNNSNDIICNSFKILENGQLVDLDTKIASASVDINTIINDNTFKNLNTLNNYTLTTDINSALALKVNTSTLSNYMLTTDINTALSNKHLFEIWVPGHSILTDLRKNTKQPS